MRIALYGASGTGKTTLARMIAEELQLSMNPVGSRSVAQAMGFDSPYDVDRAGMRAEFQRRLLSEKVAWERDREAFVTDRTTLDNLTYTLMHDVGAIDAPMLAEARRAFFRYTHAVFCPIGIFQNVGDDRARVQSNTYHWLFEVVIQALVNNLSEEVEAAAVMGGAEPTCLRLPRLFVCTVATPEARRSWVRSLADSVLRDH